MEQEVGRWQQLNARLESVVIHPMNGTMERKVESIVVGGLTSERIDMLKNARSVQTILKRHRMILKGGKRNMATEKRLIDANVFAEHLERMTKTTYSNLLPGLLEAAEFARNFIPTVDAVEVVHGRWIAMHDGWGCCSNCRRMDEIHDLATHCRFCGAKMDGDGNDI